MGSPIRTDYHDYKRDEQRASDKVKEYFRDEEEWENSRHSTAYLPPHVCSRFKCVNLSNVQFHHLQLRNEDAFDTRQSSAAAEASRRYQSAREKRDEHNDNYIGHWKREQREVHFEAASWAQARSNENRARSQKHLDVRILTPCIDDTANLGSPATVDGVPNGRQRWTLSRKRIIEACIVRSFGG